MTHSIFAHLCQQKRALPFLCALAVLVAGCVYPVPTPIVTPTPAPYPAPADRSRPDPYPPPLAQPGVLYSDAPSCEGSIEYPSEIWGDERYIYSRTCIWSGLAGASVILFDQLAGSTTWVYGQWIGQVNSCVTYRYDPPINGCWLVQVMVSDPGGVTLCDISSTTIDRWWHVFPVMQLEVQP